MNAADCCHEIPGCKGIYVDAFRGKYLKKTADSKNSFILTHYHGDHYGSLPRENKYQGPALIHCTPTTCRLLCEIHEVPPAFVRAHEYGETFDLPTHSGKKASITFYDANHCPGAAIVFVKAPDGLSHVHCGDMRYHPKMMKYQLLQEAAANNMIDTVLLDTTYGHPKHDFCSQEDAVEQIASQAHEVIQSPSRTLVLLSCYSIGKERVLWEASKRCNQSIYVADKKYRMMECIAGYKGDNSSQIVQCCTRDQSETDIHVIPMGLAGEMWPFFQPKYAACVECAQKTGKEYDNVVAFLPTGWAEASNWNKKMSVSRATVQGVDVEIRLVGYSEHSSFAELETFVKFLNPRKVVPTVFQDAKDAHKIAARFPVDVKRAQKHAIESMFGSAVVELKSPQAAKRPKVSSAQQDPPLDESIKTILGMGFDRDRAQRALNACKNNVQKAIDLLLVRKDIPPAPQPSPKPVCKPKAKTITSFFSPKS